MLKILLITLLSFVPIFAIETLKPTYSLATAGNAQSLVVDGDKLYVGEDNGKVEVFDLNSKKVIDTIAIPNIIDFMGDEIAAKIYSIDKIEDKLLIVSQGMKGYRNIFLYEDKKLEKIIGIESKYFIQKASFVSSDEIIFGLLSNQIGLYNYKTKKLSYLVQISGSSFSHFMISEDKQTIATTDESGKVRILDIKSARVTHEYPGINLDRVYQLDYKKGIVLTAGQDRKSVVFNGSKHYALDFDFLLYSCALNKQATLGAIAYNENNDVMIFDIKSEEKLFNLTGQKATLTQILFKSNNELFISSDSKSLNYFNLNTK